MYVYCYYCENYYTVFGQATRCPECKGEIRKVYSTVGIVFKGSGFYKTDSAVKPAPAAKTETSSS